MTRIMMVTPNFENNSLGRTWCLWLLAEHLGWETEIHGVKGRRLWAPLADSKMAQACHVPREGESEAVLMDRLAKAARRADLIVAVKPLVPSFGIALELRDRTGTPVLLDIDDPDIEVRTTWKPIWERTARFILKSEYRSLRRLARRIPEANGITVSNPVLHDLYGGTIIAHVREAVKDRRASVGYQPVVRFVGSVRGHKGVEVLRQAVALVADRGIKLEITDDPPADAHPWETWLGTTGIEEGKQLVADADIIAVPSENRTWSRAQLPAKLLDAMAAGRSIVASDLPTITWATGQSALHVAAGSPRELANAITELCDPVRRESLGEAALAEAKERFTPEVLGEQWRQLCEEIIHDHEGK